MSVASYAFEILKILAAVGLIAACLAGVFGVFLAIAWVCSKVENVLDAHPDRRPALAAFGKLSLLGIAVLIACAIGFNVALGVLHTIS